MEDFLQGLINQVEAGKLSLQNIESGFAHHQQAKEEIIEKMDNLPQYMNYLTTNNIVINTKHEASSDDTVFPNYITESNLTS